MKKLIPML